MPDERPPAPSQPSIAGRWKKGQSGNPKGKRNPANTKSWQKGQSGNPNGTPGWVKQVRAAAGAKAPEALECLYKLLKNKNPIVRERAAEAILDRAGCRPFSYEPEKVDVSGSAVNIAINWKRPNDTGSGSPP